MHNEHETNLCFQLHILKGKNAFLCEEFTFSKCVSIIQWSISCADYSCSYIIKLMEAKQQAAVFIHNRNTLNVHIPFNFYSETKLNSHTFPSVGAQQILLNDYCWNNIFHLYPQSLELVSASLSGASPASVVWKIVTLPVFDLVKSKAHIDGLPYAAGSSLGQMASRAGPCRWDLIGT